jgi:hypothetical protein
MRRELKPENERVVAQTRVWGSGGEWVLSTVALTEIGVFGDNYETDGIHGHSVGSRAAD